MSKTPYEIRLDVLQLAQSMLESKREHELDIYKVNANNGIHLPNSSIPEMYDSNSVIEKATELYSFIQSRTPTNS